MTSGLSEGDANFCRIYGEQSHAYYGNSLPWDFGVHRMREGWQRVREHSNLNWSEAEPCVRARRMESGRIGDFPASEDAQHAPAAVR